ncbi:MAG: hypothetical protein Q7R45_11600, partial [Sulfuricaulis sp.]|nr:hypothetical protein [Sulfuricaulis sp.]
MRIIAERILGEFAGAPGAKRASHAGDIRPSSPRFDDTGDPVQDSVDLQRYRDSPGQPAAQGRAGTDSPLRIYTVRHRHSR